MAKIKYEASLTPLEFELFSKFLKDLKELREKGLKINIPKTKDWVPSNKRK